MKRYTRASLAALGALALVGSLAACNPAVSGPAQPSEAAPDDTSEPITINYSAPVAGALPFLPVDVAIAKGYFEDEGIELNVVQTSAQAMPAALAGNQLDMSADVVYNIGRYLQSGVEVQFVSGLNENVDFTLLAAKGFDIPEAEGADGWKTSFEALRGQSIGVAAKAGPIGLTVTQLMSEAGVQPGEYTLIDTPGPAAGNALAAGQVAAVISGGGFDLPLVENGLADRVFRLDAGIPHIFGEQSNAALFMTAQAIAAKPGAAERVQKAIEKAVAFIQDPANLEEVVTIATAGGTPESKELADRISEYSYNATLSLAGLESGFDWAETAGITDSVIDAKATIAEDVAAE
ncbi:ABC transporter substrate-binding protein [Microbacterium hydrocarbonoxydans]|uniref:ABC transporter substrate-binding protein n=1 Tax=Microbacterium hydrocarbonoxydans TaxID=273678 RepID=UPI0007BC6656|nr:ABC transporter substrate-binding protein [Microbacterium hydrocarbonoxydans]GAT72379.1 hypothetical protein MHM582_0852 [Microbacterium sp. HM58-2]